MLKNSEIVADWLGVDKLPPESDLGFWKGFY